MIMKEGGRHREVYFTYVYSYNFKCTPMAYDHVFGPIGSAGLIT